MAMYTAEEIRNIEFTKTMGGYKAAEVDSFIDRCADTVEALAAEKADLNKKMTLLADKLVEYRKEEDSIRSALLSAQRLGDSTVREANEKAEKIVARAKQQAEQVLAEVRKQAESAEAKGRQDVRHYEIELARLKHEVSDFKGRMVGMYKEHLSLLKSIPDEVEEAPVEEPQQAAPVAEKVPEVKEEPAAPQAAPADMTAEAVAAVAPVTVSVPVQPTQPDSEPEVVLAYDQPNVAEADDDYEDAPVSSRFSDLKFGEDYDIGDDEEELDGGKGGFFGRRHK